MSATWYYQKNKNENGILGINPAGKLLNDFNQYFHNEEKFQPGAAMQKATIKRDSDSRMLTFSVN